MVANVGKLHEGDLPGPEGGLAPKLPCQPRNPGLGRLKGKVALRYQRR